MGVTVKLLQGSELRSKIKIASLNSKMTKIHFDLNFGKNSPTGKSDQFQMFFLAVIKLMFYEQKFHKI